MQYKTEHELIETVKNSLERYKNGSSDFPFTIEKREFVPNETPCGQCDHQSGTLIIYKDEPVIFAHELTHLLDSKNHPDWFTHKFPYDVIHFIDKSLKVYRMVDRDWRKINPEKLRLVFVCLYILDPIEIRANVIAYLATGVMPPYLEIIPELEAFLIDNCNNFELTKNEMPDLTPEHIVKRYYDTLDFVKRKTEASGCRLLRSIENDPVFQKYGI